MPADAGSEARGGAVAGVGDATGGADGTGSAGGGSASAAMTVVTGIEKRRLARRTRSRRSHCDTRAGSVDTMISSNGSVSTAASIAAIGSPTTEPDATAPESRSQVRIRSRR